MNTDARDTLDAKLAALGRAIKGKRIERGLSREELASLTGVSKSQVGKIERGQRGSFKEVWTLTEALGVPFGETIIEADRSVS